MIFHHFLPPSFLRQLKDGCWYEASFSAYTVYCTVVLVVHTYLVPTDNGLAHSHSTYYTTVGTHSPPPTFFLFLTLGRHESPFAQSYIFYGAWLAASLTFLLLLLYVLVLGTLLVQSQWEKWVSTLDTRRLCNCKCTVYKKVYITKKSKMQCRIFLSLLGGVNGKCIFALFVRYQSRKCWEIFLSPASQFKGGFLYQVTVIKLQWYMHSTIKGYAVLLTGKQMICRVY